MRTPWYEYCRVCGKDLGEEDSKNIAVYFEDGVVSVYVHGNGCEVGLERVLKNRVGGAEILRLEEIR